MPLGVMVEVGAGVAGDAPHPVGGPPADRRPSGTFCGIARMATPRRTASRAGAMISSRLQTRARILSRIFMLASRSGVKCSSSARRRPGYRRRPCRPGLGHRQPRLGAVDTGWPRRVDRGFGSSHRTRHAPDRQGEAAAELLERVGSGPWPASCAARRRSRNPRGEPDEDQRKARSPRLRASRVTTGSRDRRPSR